MGISTGYGRTVTSGSIFAFDTADVINSYKGEPTVNYCSADSNLVANIDCSTANATAVLPDGDIGTVRRVTVVADTYGGIIRASLTHNLPSSGIPQAGQSYTISCWIRNSSGVAVAAGWEPEVGQPDGYLRPNVESGFNGNYAASSQPNTLSSNWTRVSYTYSYTSTQTSQIVPFIYFGHPVGGSGSGVGATIDFHQIQIEVKSHATPFVNGTRLATEALCPLAGNATLDLANVSFDSNAKITFDGTDDYAVTSNIPAMSNWTAEVVINLTNYTTAQKVILDVNLGIRLETSNGYFNSHFGNGTGWIYTNLPSASTYTANKYYHIVIAIESGGYAKMYINGILDNSISISSGTTPTLPLYIGRFSGSPGYEITGTMPVTKIYNRALTEGEVRQNYNKYKTRFKLS
jgi:hypothetical protein